MRRRPSRRCRRSAEEIAEIIREYDGLQRGEDPGSAANIFVHSSSDIVGGTGIPSEIRSDVKKSAAVLDRAKDSKPQYGPVKSKDSDGNPIEYGKWPTRCRNKDPQAKEQYTESQTETEWKW